ncbi:helix-turn-helix domain-containing protein [Pseudodonghicola sp.]|uniref:helix-turn-helix domain-containing protein n=1 Tax=Pseudodonghicola sp. TaxID=1969463 RepID=UPI003A97B4FD
MISSAQIRAARALLGLSQSAVAEAAGISVPTLKRAEGASAISASDKAILLIHAALEAAGVEFIPENGGGVGVRLKKPDNG